MNPYINASIIMQLMTGVIPSLQALSREGEYGRNKINQYTRYLAVPMALLQSYGFLALLNSQQRPDRRGFDLASCDDPDPDRDPDRRLDRPDVARRADHREGHRQRHQLHHLRRHRQPRPGRHRRVPGQPEPRRWSSRSRSSRSSRSAVIIYIQEGQRRIPIQYASRVRGRRMYQGGQTFLPLRVNQAGVIPIIFAVSILLFPQPDRARTSRAPRSAGRQAIVATAIVDVLQPALAARTSLLYFLLTVGLHLLLHGVHVQARRDRRAAPQERRLHPGHPAGPPDRRTTSPGS